jgi:hypothetical protein
VTSLLPLIVCLIVLFLILSTTLVLLYLMALRQSRASLTQQSEFLSTATEIAIAQARQAQEAAEAQMADNQSRFDRTIETLTQELARSQTLTQRSMDLTLTRALDGSNKVTERVQATLQSTLTMLGTKDPIAYSQVFSGASPTSDSGTGAYTSVDEIAEQEAREAALASDQLDAALAELTGLTRVGANGAASGGTEPYSGQSEG